MGGNDAQKAQSSGGGDMQSKLIGMAMAEAMKVSRSCTSQNSSNLGASVVLIRFPGHELGREVMNAHSLLVLLISRACGSCSAALAVRPLTAVDSRTSSTPLESVSPALPHDGPCR